MQIRELGESGGIFSETETSILPVAVQLIISPLMEGTRSIVRFSTECVFAAALIPVQSQSMCSKLNFEDTPIVKSRE